VYVHLERDYQLPDQHFFCDNDQAVMARVNWLVLRSDLYFAPGLFLVPQFEDELRWMFPAADTVFHHVGRYLFHPSNRVWELVARYYTSYMSNFEEKIGLQIAAVSWNPVPVEEYIKQIVACTTHQKILPDVDPDAAASTTAVLVSAAQPQFADWLKAMYYEHATATGEAVSVLQLSVGKQPRNYKALAEMFLQSYCDVSVVSGWSTVVYVSHSSPG
jgi:xyloglucan fucosyltransferase